MRSLAEKVSYCALFTVFGLMLSYIEGLIPLNMILPIPGFKLGLANIAVLFAFFTFGFSCAAFVSLCRITLSALLFGTVNSFLFSISGGLLTLVALLLYKQLLHRFNGIIGLSVLCAAMHNIGQCLACAALFSYQVLTFYLPYLLLISLVTGSLTGILASKYSSFKIFQKGSSRI